MAAISKHKYDVRDWLYKVIDSCTTIAQWISAKKLFRLFQKKYDWKEYGDDTFIMHQCLEVAFNRKWNEITKDL